MREKRFHAKCCKALKTLQKSSVLTTPPTKSLRFGHCGIFFFNIELLFCCCCFVSRANLSTIVWEKSMKKLDLLYKITFLKYIYLLRQQDASTEMNKNQMLQSQDYGNGLKYCHVIVTSSPSCSGGPRWVLGWTARRCPIVNIKETAGRVWRSVAKNTSICQGQWPMVGTCQISLQ